MYTPVFNVTCCPEDTLSDLIEDLDAWTFWIDSDANEVMLCADDLAINIIETPFE